MNTAAANAVVRFESRWAALVRLVCTSLLLLVAAGCVVAPANPQQLAQQQVSAAVARGDYDSAIRLAIQFEAEFSQGSDPRAVSPVDGQMINMAVGLLLTAGRVNEASAMFDKYPDTADRGKDSNIVKAVYATQRQIVRGDLALARGDVNAGWAAQSAALAEWSRREPGVEAARRHEYDQWRHTMLVMMYSSAIDIGRFEDAQRILQELRRMKANPEADSEVLQEEAAYAQSLGLRDEAVDKYEKSRGVLPASVRNLPGLIQQYQVQLAVYQALARRFAAADKTLASLGPATGINNRTLRLEALCIHAYAAAMEGGDIRAARDDLVRQSELLRQVNDTGRLLYYGTRTIAGEAAARASGGDKTLLLDAVNNGKSFATQLTTIRSRGFNTELGYSGAAIDDVRAAYLRAAAQLQQTGDLNFDDLLVAISLAQETDIDLAMSSAAARGAGLAGLPGADLRAYQDAQIKARGTRKRLLALLATNNTTEVDQATREDSAAEAALESQIGRMDRLFPGFARLLSGSPVSLAAIRQRFANDEGLVVLAPSGDVVVVAVVTKTAAVARMIPFDHRQLEALVDAVRASVDLGTTSKPPPFAVQPAHELYERLLGWAATPLATPKELVFAASGKLAAIPMSLLVTDPVVAAGASDYAKVPWLVRRYAVAHAPSVGTWFTSGARKAATPAASGLIAWADPDFGGTRPAQAQRGSTHRVALRRDAVPTFNDMVAANPRELLDTLPELPETRAEVSLIARAAHANEATDVILGSRATRSSVLDASSSGLLARKGTVVFATHGVGPSDLPWLHQPALVMAKTADPLQSPLLVLDDVLVLHMNADWVLLSACNSASAGQPGGDALGGLARGFFYAGAKALLVTHWSVDSESAGRLTAATMSRYWSNDRPTRAQALRAAELDQIDGKMHAADGTVWSHPAFWAGYALIGDPRR